MIILDNRIKFKKVPKKKLKKIAKFLTHKTFELILTDNQTIKELNYKFRNINKETDVLSFPIIGENNIGSIVISIDFVKKNSKKYKHKKSDELLLLFIHGLLHLIGYDHEIDNGEMREMEKKIIKKFSLPKSLIVRVS